MWLPEYNTCMDNYHSTRKNVVFFRIFKPSGEKIYVTNIKQVAKALGTWYSHVWKKVNTLYTDNVEFVVIKGAVVSLLKIPVTRFEGDIANDK